MTGYYKVSAIGTDHLDKEGGVCQDYSDVRQTENGFTVAVIADGLGSAVHSDIGAKAAVNAVLDFVCPRIAHGQNEDYYLDLLERAYEAAYNSVVSSAEAIEAKAADLNTTLTAAIYDGRRLIYGQCGDGGIIALTYQGEYVCVTSVKKGEAFNETFPLLGGRRNWSFGVFQGEVCALTMMTDGIFDIVCHPLLANEAQKINIPFIRRFMDRNILRANNAEDFRTLQAAIEKFVSGNGLQGVTDDKTIVGLINTEIMPKLMNDDYYKEPDWDGLKARMEQRLRSVFTPEAEEPVSKADDEPQTSDARPQNEPPNIQRATHEKEALKRLEERCGKLEMKNRLLSMIAAAELAVILLLTICLCICFFVKNTDKRDNSRNSVSHSASGVNENKGELSDDLLQQDTSEQI